MTYSVGIIVSGDAGDWLRDLADRIHVWVCDTPGNRTKVERYWDERPGTSIERGMTIFTVDSAQSPEEILLEVLPDVDLHHGEFSHDPPWQQLEIYGTAVTEAVRSALMDLGVTELQETPFGFRCSRPAGAK